MKRKNILSKTLSENKGGSQNQKNNKQQKRFVDTALCQSDSEESLLETNTNYSVMNRNKNQNKLADFYCDSSNNKNENLENQFSNSPKRPKNSISNVEKNDIQKKLYDFKIIEKENEIGDANKNKQKVKNKDPFNYIEFEEYPCDHSALKQIDFDLKICFGQRTPEKLKRNCTDENSSSNALGANKHIGQDFSKEISAMKNIIFNYFNKNILIYYVFKNSNNGNESKVNHLEANNNYMNNNDKIGSKIASAKEDTYIESLNYIFSKLLESNSDEIPSSKFNNFTTKSKNENENKFFYILLPLYACYFFNNLESELWENRKQLLNENGILISNVSRNLEKKINDKGITYEKIDSNFSDLAINSFNNNNNNGNSSRRKLSESKSVRSNNNNNNSNFNYINNYSHFIQGDYNELGSDSSIIYIKNFNQILFFNEFINTYEESYFRIISPYPFANSHCTLNQFHVDVHKNDESNFTFKVKIIGCIFQTQLKKLLEFFQGISESFAFGIHHYHKTPAFHLVSDKLKQTIENVKYENKKFYVRAKK